MQKYEIMAIIVSDLDEKTAEAHIQEFIIGKIKELGGNITFEDFWGSRGFAYRIKQYTWGHYFVAQFEIAPTQINQLRTELNIDNKILRHIIITVDKNAPAPRKYADVKKEYEAQEKATKADETEAAEKKIAKREKLSTVKKTEKPEVAKEDEGDDVDQAIDKVLDDATADL
ncbi:MAG TPA: 30S ribosomal protein S6 [Candidatus Gracilibacteria bacterium]